ncbi:MAG: hypothetical protein HY328_18955 [Chloroflexi bacterium]|nr:hypothetical protein [Chloroflexota bacterium]
MNSTRGKLFIVTSVLALLLVFFASVALAQDTGPNTATPDGPAATSETANGNWLQRMQEWMGPEAWGQMIQRMTQVHGAEFTGQMLQQMNETGGCHADGAGFSGMMGGLGRGFWGGMTRGFGGMTGGAGR